MTKHKVSELEGALLDVAVALAWGWNPALEPVEHFLSAEFGGSPSSQWAAGGSLIERERIPNDGDLAAAMRTYVARKLGEEVELP